MIDGYTVIYTDIYGSDEPTVEWFPISIEWLVLPWTFKVPMQGIAWWKEETNNQSWTPTKKKWINLSFTTKVIKEVL